MKVIFVIIFVLISNYFPLLSQNLVPNYNFSELDSCPNNKGQIYFASPWYSSNGKTTDLIHTCNTNGIAGVPKNKWGTQYPFNGNGMAGIRTYLAGENIEPNYREYLAVQLRGSLEKDKKYYISFKASPGENNAYYSDNLALHISENRIPSTPFLQLKPTISNRNGFMNNFNAWYDISGMHVAKGGERFLVIGNFNDDKSTNLVEQFRFENKEKSAYYFIDNVIVKECNSIWPKNLIRSSTDSICSGGQADLSINFKQDSLISYFWQDSLSSDSLFSISEPGEYKLSVSYNNFCHRTDTIVIWNKGSSINLGQDTTLCPGEELSLAIEPEPETAIAWENGSSNWEKTIQRAGEYSVIINKNGCLTTDTIKVSYVDPSRLITEKDTIICEGQSIVLDVDVGESDYLWNTGDRSSQIKVDSTGLFAVNIDNQCFFHNSQFFVTVSPCGCDANIPNVITPNQDGYNDEFTFELPLKSELIEYNILNRWGEILFTSSDKEITWRGFENSKKVTNGVYYYSIVFSCMKSNGEKSTNTVKGPLSVMY